MLGRDVIDRLPRAGRTRSSPSATPDLDITDARCARRGARPATGPTRWSTAPPGPTSTAPRTTRPARCGSTTRARAARWRPRPIASGPRSFYPSSDYVFDGIRAEAVRRVGHARAHLGLRPLQAGRRDLGRGRQPAPLHRPLLVALRPGRQATSSRRCCGSATSSPRCWSSPTRSAARPTRGTSPRRSPLLLEGEDYGIHHIAGGGPVLLVRVRAGDLRPGRASSAG